MLSTDWAVLKQAKFSCNTYYNNKGTLINSTSARISQLIINQHVAIYYYLLLS